jgi:hypothetical protein
MRIVKDKQEYGIATAEIDILYMIDYLYLTHNMETKNILLRTPYFSIALINNITIEFIEHSKEEGENLQFFAMLFNNTFFIYADLLGLYDKIDNKGGANTPVTLLFFAFMGGFGYWFYDTMFAVQEDIEEEQEISYVMQDEAGSKTMKQKKEKKEYKLVSEQQKVLVDFFLQRNFINAIIGFGQDNKVENMFKMIESIAINNDSHNYEMTILSLLPEAGYKRKKELFEKKIKLNNYTDDKNYRNALNEDIIKKEKDYVDFFLNNKEIKKNFYTTRIKDFLEDKEMEYRLNAVSEHIMKVNDSLNIDNVTNDKKIQYLKTHFGFKLEEVTLDDKTVLSKNGPVDAMKLYELMRYLRDMNILVDKFRAKKKTSSVNSMLFNISECQITINNKG